MTHRGASEQEVLIEQEEICRTMLRRMPARYGISSCFMPFFCVDQSTSLYQLPCFVAERTVEEGMLIVSSLHDLYEQYPDFYRQRFILRPARCCISTLQAWVAPRSARIEQIGSLWVSDGLSDADMEWLCLHQVDVEEFIDEILDHDEC